MGHVVVLNSEGQLVYYGLLSSKERATVDEILNALRAEIPQIEEDLENVYGKGVLYKYHLGLVLGDMLEKYNISVSERRKFWDEIKTLVTQKTRKREDGKNSSRRCFYEQCYILSRLPVETVKKLTWMQWQDLLDRNANRTDERIFLWIGSLPTKVREDDWREFEKALHLYLKDKDTSVFDNEELFAIYDSIMLMCTKWREQFKQFMEEHPKSAKIKTKGTWAKKYYSRCFALKKEQRIRVITEEICVLAYAELMK